VIDRTPKTEQQSNLGVMLANALALRGHISEAWSVAVANRAYVLAEISGLGLVPPDSAVKVLRPLLEMRSDVFFNAIPALALARDTTTLLAQAARLERGAQRVAPTPRAVMLKVARSLRGYAMLAKGDTAGAARLFDLLSDSSLAIPFDEFIRARLIGNQDPRRGIALLERRVSPASLLYPARELERGRLAERIGDRERAVDAYAFVAAIWRDAESESLRAAAKEASEAFERLDSDGRVRPQLVPVSPKR